MNKFEVATAPVINYKVALQEIGTNLDKRLTVMNLDNLVVNEDNVKEIKELRATLNKESKEYEEARKLVKKAVNDPYTQFELAYKEQIGDKYKNADTTLKTAIDEIENGLKQDKEDELRKFVAEWLEEENIDWLTFERIGLNITLSASMKSLKEEALGFISKVKNELKLIDTQEHKERIIVRYKQTLEVAGAISSVLEEVKQEEEMKAREVVIETPIETPVVQKVEKLEAPKEVVTVTFRVSGTKEEVIKVREFMKEEGIKYE